MASFFDRMKKRKVVQWCMGYLTASWLLLQVADTVGDTVAWVDGLRPTLLGADVRAVVLPSDQQQRLRRSAP